MTTMIMIHDVSRIVVDQEPLALDTRIQQSTHLKVFCADPQFPEHTITLFTNGDTPALIATEIQSLIADNMLAELQLYRAIREKAISYLNGKHSGTGIELLYEIERITPS